MSELLLKTKGNINNISMLLEKCNENFYGFRWEGESLEYGYNVNDCGNKQEICSRLKSLISIVNDQVKDCTIKGYDILVNSYKEEVKMYSEMLDVMELQ